MPEAAVPLRHPHRAALLSLLLPLLAATEFIENGSFLFAAGHIAQGLEAGPADFAGVLASFATCSMVMVALQQSLTRHFGYRRYLLGALTLFQVGALGSLLSDSAQSLMLARAVQGLGAGALFTSGRILVVLLFEPAERSQALRRFIGGVFGLSSIGPVLAAGLIHSLGWRAAFAVPLPLALICTVAVACMLPEGVGRLPQPPRQARIRHALLLVAAIALTQWALAEARYPLQFEALHLAGLLLAAALSLAAWAWHQHRHPTPLLQWHGWRHPGYAVGLVLYGLYYLISNANGLVIPVFAEQALGWPTWQMGCLSSGGALVSWLTAQAYLRWGTRSRQQRAWMAAAAVWMALACASLALLQPSNTGLLLGVAAKGAFSAMLVLPLAGLTFRALTDEHFGSAYQLKNLLRHLMSSGGMALAALGLAGPGLLLGTGLAASSLVFAGLSLASTILAALVLLQRHLR